MLRNYFAFLTAFIIFFAGFIVLAFGSYIALRTNILWLACIFTGLLLIWLMFTHVYGGFIIHHKQNGLSALLQSCQLTLRYWWRVVITYFCVMLLFGLSVYITLELLQFLLYRLLLLFDNSYLESFFNVLFIILPAFFFPFLYAFSVILYEDLQRRQNLHKK